MPQIRLTRTEEVNTVLSYLRERYPLLSEAEIIKMVLSEKYRDLAREGNVIDLETHSITEDLKDRIQVPRERKSLLSMAGVFKGAKDLSSNKKKYIY